jgi:hypothetical protein
VNPNTGTLKNVPVFRKVIVIICLSLKHSWGDLKNLECRIPKIFRQLHGQNLTVT